MFSFAVTNAFLCPKAPRSASLVGTRDFPARRKDGWESRPVLPRGQRACLTPGHGADTQRSRVQSKCLLLKPRNGRFRDCCPHGPAGSPSSCTPSLAEGRRPAGSPAARPCSPRQAGTRGAGRPGSARDGRVRGGPGPLAPEAVFRAAGQRAVPTPRRRRPRG